MKVKVKYTAIGLRGEQITEVIEHELPDFKERHGVSRLVSNDRPISCEYVISIDQQIMDHLDDMDKRDMMYDRDWYAIVDYEIYQEVTDEAQAENFKNLVNLYTEDENVRGSLYVAYASLYDKIKGESLAKQLDLTIASLDLALRSQGYAYQRMIDLLRSDPREYSRSSDFNLINPKNKHDTQRKNRLDL